MYGSEYPLFVPPDDLGNRTPKEWSNNEATVYFNWLVQVSNERTTNLMSFFNDNIDGRPNDILERLGKKVTKTLRIATFSIQVDGRHKLTNKGYALAADMGLLVAKFILEEFYPVVTWTIVNRPKTDIDYHKPVLTNIGRETYEPIGVSISDAIGILNGTKDYDSWEKTYSYCKAVINNTKERKP